MERNDDEMIRSKVMGLESEPVVLDKELLWSTIPFPAARRERSSLVYYAAASVAMAWALVFIFQELSRRDQLQVRLRELELMIQSESTSSYYSTSVTPTEVPCESPTAVAVVPPPKRVIRREPPARESRPNTAVAEVPAPTTSTGTAATIVEEAKTPPDPILSEQSVAKPRVVLGSAMPETAANVRRNQRLHLGLFREEEGVTPHAPVVTLAGVNN